MEELAFLVLVGVTLLLGWFAFRSRERYRNLEAGSGYREELLGIAVRILRDPDAPQAARSAADFILAALYDGRFLRRALRSSSGQEHAEGTLPDGLFGEYSGPLRDAVRYLVALALLSDEQTGSAMRTLTRAGGSASVLVGQHHLLAWLSNPVRSQSLWSAVPHVIRAARLADRSGNPDALHGLESCPRGLDDRAIVAVAHLPLGQAVTSAIRQTLAEVAEHHESLEALYPRTALSQ